MVSSLDDLTQKIIVPINQRDTVEDLIEQNVNHFAEKDTDSGKTNTIKVSFDTVNYPAIKYYTELLFLSVQL